MLSAAIVLVALVGSARAQRALPLSSFQYPSAPLLPIAPLIEYNQVVSRAPLVRPRVFQAPQLPPTNIIVTNQGHGGYQVNPCSPSPCGRNTVCEVNAKNIALCKCAPNFVPDGHTINGCKPQCLRNSDCPDDYRCVSNINKCERVCQLNDCGIGAECVPRNHRSECRCPTGYDGNPDISCIQKPVIVHQPTDPCTPNPCGVNAECRAEESRAVCVCLQRFEGDPLTGCSRSECLSSNDCPLSQACQQRRCINPCRIKEICGRNSDCIVKNHQPVCSCPRGFVGDPFVNCRRFNPMELCQPSPCGHNTHCRVQNDRAVCSCFEDHVGDPLTGCRPECVTHSDCPPRNACQLNKCVNPCRGACGEGALCDVRNGQAVCRCPEFYLGNPQSRCYPECTVHEDCRSHQACYQLKCVDPCVGACGTGADCKVDKHKPICSCPRGYTGHPFERCTKFAPEDLCRPNPCGRNAQCKPGYDREGNDRPVCICPSGYLGNPLSGCSRGECEVPTDCRPSQTCHRYRCTTACYTDVGSVCGVNAVCVMKNHQPVCSCPPGYHGDPLRRCHLDRRARFIVGRSK